VAAITGLSARVEGSMGLSSLTWGAWQSPRLEGKCLEPNGR